jgi:hypothetical protein
MATSLRNDTAQFWAAANYLRRAAPNAPLRGHAFRIMLKLADKSTGTVQERAAEFLKGKPDEPTCYDH